MLPKIITNGDTGVAQAAWKVAIQRGYETGGMMRHGFLTTDGPRPEFAKLYEARESRSTDPKVVVAFNVMLSNVAVWLGPTTVTEFHQLWTVCHRSRPDSVAKASLDRRIIIYDDMEIRLVHSPLEIIPVRDLLMGNSFVYIGGPTEKQIPGISTLVSAFLNEVFRFITVKREWDSIQKSKPKKGSRRK
jgi:hypothetical protein